jgi:hypothetical protein
MCKHEVLLSRAAGYEHFSEFRPEHKTDKVALAASEALSFWVKRGRPPAGIADVGIRLKRDANGFMVVKDVLPNSPAEESGEVAAGNLVHFIGEDDLEDLTAPEAEAYLKGPDASNVHITLSDVHGALQGNLRVLPLRRQMPDNNGNFARRAASSVICDDTDDTASVVRLVLDGNFEKQLKDDAAAQQVYGIRLCADVADSLQVPKWRLSVSSLQAGSILANIRVSGAPPDESASAPDPADSASMPGHEQSKSAFVPTRHRSAQDIAAELAEQASNPMSALRIKRPDVKSGHLVSGRPGPAATTRGAGGRDTGDAEEAPSIDVIDVVTGEFVSEAGQKQKKKEQPSDTGVAGEELQRREQARELGSSTISHAAATRPAMRPAGGAAGDDDEDDGIPLDLLRDSFGGRVERGRQRGRAASDSEESSDSEDSDDVVDPEETVAKQINEILDDESIDHGARPQTRVCCAVTHRQFTVSAITGVSAPSPPDSDNEATDEDEDAEDGDREIRRLRKEKEKREKFEEKVRDINAPVENWGEFVVVPTWGIIISPSGAHLLRANDVVGLYAVDVEGVCVCVCVCVCMACMLWMLKVRTHLHVLVDTWAPRYVLARHGHKCAWRVGAQDCVCVSVSVCVCVCLCVCVCIAYAQPAQKPARGCNISNKHR